MTDTFLLNDFYKVIETQKTEENKFSVTISLNAAHPVFKGHFEQMPVVPGVFQTQIIKEMLQHQLNKNLLFTKGDNIKFMSMIVPDQNPVIQLEINYKQYENNYITDAKLFSENTTFTKFKGSFTIQ